MVLELSLYNQGHENNIIIFDYGVTTYFATQLRSNGSKVRVKKMVKKRTKK